MNAARAPKHPWDTFLYFFEKIGFPGAIIGIVLVFGYIHGGEVVEAHTEFIRAQSQFVRQMVSIQEEIRNELIQAKADRQAMLLSLRQILESRGATSYVSETKPGIQKPTQEEYQRAVDDVRDR